MQIKWRSIFKIQSEKTVPSEEGPKSEWRVKQNQENICGSV